MQLVINAGGVSGQLATWNLNRNFQSLVNKANDVIKSFKIVKDATYSLRGGVGPLQHAVDNIDARIRQEQEKKAKIVDFHNTVSGFLNLAEETDRRVASYFSSSTKSAPSSKSVAATAKKKSWLEKVYDGCCNFGKKVREKVVESAKWVGEKVSDAWDGTKSAVKKAWNWAKDFYNRNKKVINKVIQTVVIVVIAAFTIAGVIATGGAALVGLLGFIGIYGSVATTIAGIIVGIAVVSTAVAATMNVADTWLEIDNPVFNTIQTVANLTSAISTFICDVAGIVKAVKDIFVRRAAKKAAVSLTDDVVRALPDTPPAGMADDISKLVPDSAPNGVADDTMKLLDDADAGQYKSWFDEDNIVHEPPKSYVEPSNAIEGDFVDELLEVDVYPDGRIVPGKEGVVTKGNGTVLGKNINKQMGLPANQATKGYQNAHIIPSELSDHPAIQKIGMDMNHASNGIKLPTASGKTLSKHRGNHSVYTEFVKNQLDNIDLNMNLDDIQRAVKQVQINSRKLLQTGLPGYGTKTISSTMSQQTIIKNLQWNLTHDGASIDAWFRAAARLAN